MVNERANPKKIILSLLRDSNETVSGQKMSIKLGISRVAVWKHIKALQELGYAISSTSSGYKLEKEKNHLYSWEFENSHDNYQTFKKLSSTMDKAREEVEKGCKTYTTIIAETQSAGRGRADRTWKSDEGGLYFTSILRPELPSAYLYIYTFAASIVLKRSIFQLYHVQSELKWPNDILHNGKKLAGILTESNIRGDRINWLNLGIGVNVNNTPSLENSCSINSIKGTDQDRKILLTTFEINFKKLIKSHTPGEIRSLWLMDNLSINKNINMKSSTGQRFNGVIETVDSGGSLIIREKNNKVKQALFGDIFIRQ